MLGTYMNWWEQDAVDTQLGKSRNGDVAVMSFRGAAVQVHNS